jgi:hypothetical protein
MSTRMAFVFTIGGVLIELGFWLILRREPQPLLAMIGIWVGGAFFVGAIWGSNEWAKKENNYKRSKGEEPLC